MPPLSSAAHITSQPRSRHAATGGGTTGAGRKRAAAANLDDATYHAPGVTSSTSHKRGAATVVAEGEVQPRVKRKRVDHGHAHGPDSGSAVGRRGGEGVSASAGTRRAGGAGVTANVADRADVDGKLSLIDFNALPTEALHRYLAKFDLIPEIDPAPSSAADPCPPSYLLRPKTTGRHSTSSPPPSQALSITPANRPRREPSTSISRRRSSRLIEDERRPRLTPILADVGEVHKTLATLAERHFRSEAVKEVDTLTMFMCAARAKHQGR